MQTSKTPAATIELAGEPVTGGANTHPPRAVVVNPEPPDYPPRSTGVRRCRFAGPLYRRC